MTKRKEPINGAINQEIQNVGQDIGGSRVITYNKNKILSMGRYADRVDLLSVLLDDEKTYTMNEVDSIMETYLKGEVK